MAYLIDEAVHLVASAGLWFITIWRCRRSLASTGPDRSVWFTICFLALAGTVDLWPLHRAIDTVAGHPVAGSVVTHTFVVLAGLSVIDMWMRVAGDSLRWSHRLGAAVAMASAAVPLSSTPSQSAISSTNEFYDPAWPTVVHWIAYGAFMAWAFCISISVCRGYRRVSSPGSRRTGVTLIAVGCGGGLLYVGWKATVLVGTGYGAGPTLVAWDTTVDTLIIGPSLLLVAFGASYEALTARAQAGLAAVDAWLSIRRLHPLWERLIRAAPQVALDPQRGRWLDVWSPRDVHLRLHRRVIEIRDGIAAVRMHVPSAVQGEAERMAAEAAVDAQARAAVAEAAWVALGCRLAAMGCPVATEPATARDASPGVRDEVTWLVAVAQAAPAVSLVEGLERHYRRQSVSA